MARDRVYVPSRISCIETRTAVATLCNALDACGAASYGNAKESICRLLGWMCEQNPSERPHEDVFGHFLDE